MNKLIQQRQALITTKQLPIYAIIPCFNEAASIQEFIATLSKQLELLTNKFQLIIIDDGSYDTSIDKILELKQSLPEPANIKIIQLSRNFGKELALFAGIEYLITNQQPNIKSNNLVAITIDADLQHPINLIPQMLEFWGKGSDMVYGIRKHRSDQTVLQRLLVKCFYNLMQCISKIPITPHAGDFRLLDYKIIKALSECKEKHRFTKGLYAWVGFNSHGIEFQAAKRTSGKSTFGIKNSTKLALTGIIAFSNIPLRIWGLLGLWISAISFSYGLYLVLKTMIYGVDVPGYLSLILAIMFFGGIQLLSIGILGEYIARIFDETKQRPGYIVNNIFE
jgi:glycosyltransferase involved in cell wall biosynthesis